MVNKNRNRKQAAARGSPASGERADRQIGDSRDRRGAGQQAQQGRQPDFPAQEVEEQEEEVEQQNGQPPPPPAAAGGGGQQRGDLAGLTLADFRHLLERFERKLRRDVQAEVQALVGGAQAAGAATPTAADVAPALSPTATQPGPAQSDAQLYSMLCAICSVQPPAAADAHKNLYKAFRMLAQGVKGARAAGDGARADKLLDSLLAMSSLAEKSAEFLGPRPSVGLSAMLRYIQANMVACLETPEKVEFSCTAATAVLESLRAEGGRGGGSGGGGGARRVGRTDRRDHYRREREDSRERDRSRKAQEDRRDDNKRQKR